MRPIHLSVEGLACFKETQEIDFSGLDLFAISGPTGAGKSTLLDAILFALYGEVPRVGKQDLKEMISAARERVSVRFDFSVGKRQYRIARALRRKERLPFAWKSTTGRTSTPSSPTRCARRPRKSRACSASTSMRSPRR